MTLTYIEQRAPGSPSHTLDYEVDGDVLTITHRTYKHGEPPEEGAETPVIVDVETVDTFDFSALPSGAVVEVDEIETDLSFYPIREAYRDDDGELHVTLLDWAGGASDEEPRDGT